MNRILRLATSVVLAAAAAVALPALAAPPAQAQREIDRLITALGQCGCQFQRNGSWYDADDAQAHLRKKYDWLVKRDMVASAEQFIERAGSQSSISGKPYQVRCGAGPAVTSASWLSARLAEIRRTP